MPEPRPVQRRGEHPTFKDGLLRDAILSAVGDAGEACFPLKEISAAAGDRPLQDDKAPIGKPGRHMMAGKPALEAAGTIRRLPRVTPQRIVVA